MLLLSSNHDQATKVIKQCVTDSDISTNTHSLCRLSGWYEHERHSMGTGVVCQEEVFVYRNWSWSGVP